jgi:hypothetical protein
LTSMDFKFCMYRNEKGLLTSICDRILAFIMFE